MRFGVSIEADFGGWSNDQYLKLERAVSKGVTSTAASLKAAWRGEVAASLGARMGNTVRAKHYPESEPSANAASIVYVKPGKPGRAGAPEIIAAHERGATIRARNGLWMAIPLPAAGKGSRGRRLTPGEWQFRTGRKLRFVSNGRRGGLLVADAARINAKGGAIVDRRRGKFQAARASTAIPIFALVRQVSLKKSLNLTQVAEQIGATLASRISASLGD